MLHCQCVFLPEKTPGVVTGMLSDNGFQDSENTIEMLLFLLKGFNVDILRKADYNCWLFDA